MTSVSPTAIVPNPVPPGGTIGILGGGQLGRMTAQAAQRLGYKVVVLTPEIDSPAGQVCDQVIQAAYDDADALAELARRCDVVTYEFENIPYEPVAALAEKVTVCPSPRVLRITQDRLREKDFVQRLGIPTTRFRAVPSFAELAGAVAAVGRPAVLKTTRMGYDGKGQTAIREDTDLAQAWRSIGSAAAIAEAFVDFAYEASVIVARGLDGTLACYAPVANEHRNHILYRTQVPAPMDDALAEAVQTMACKIAEGLELIGLICVEMFITADGTAMVNELAPRPHNSGHWSLDACVTSQFEQFIRAVCGLPLGSPERHSDAVMKNLLGDEVANWKQILGEPGAKLHLYGKTDPRPGRKMGHVTRLSKKTS